MAIPPCLSSTFYLFQCILEWQDSPHSSRRESLLTQHIAGNRRKLDFFTSKHTSFQHAKITKIYEPWQAQRVKTSDDFWKTWEVFPKTWEIFPKTWEVFQRTWEFFLDAEEETAASPTNFSQRAKSPIVKKAFNRPLHACACAHTTGILHFLLSQPSPISL